jgi:hypothetical protein
MSKLYSLIAKQMERLRPFFPKSHGKLRAKSATTPGLLHFWGGGPPANG